MIASSLSALMLYSSVRVMAPLATNDPSVPRLKSAFTFAALSTIGHIVVMSLALPVLLNKTSFLPSDLRFSIGGGLFALLIRSW